MKKITTTKNRILIVILTVFLFIALVRTVNNFSKIYTEEGSWIGLSDFEKRKRLYGDIFVFFTFINANTQSRAKILFLTTDGRAYYLSKYYLYPRIVTVIRIDKKIPEYNLQQYDYIAVFINDEVQYTEKLKAFMKDVKKKETGKNDNVRKGILHKL